MSKKTSIIWNFFHINDNKKQLAKCDLCHVVLCFKSSITNLKKHLQRKHPTINLNVTSKKYTSSAACASIFEPGSSSSAVEDLTKSNISDETDEAVSTQVADAGRITSK